MFNINSQINEEKRQIKYLKELLKIEKNKLAALKKLKQNITCDKEPINSAMKAKKLRKWNDMTLEQKLNNPLPYPRETEKSELYDDSFTKYTDVDLLEIEEKFKNYRQSDKVTLV